MARKRHTAEEFIGKLRKAEALTAQGRSVAWRHHEIWIVHGSRSEHVALRECLTAQV